MAGNNKSGLIAIVLIVIGLFFLFSGNLQEDGQSIFKSKLKSIELALPPIKLGQNEIIKVEKFPVTSLYSIIEPENLFATVVDPKGSGDWCFDSPCSCQCSGSFSFCDDWLNKKSPCSSGQEEIIKTCPSGTVDVGNSLCCPTQSPNYCSQNNLCYDSPNCGAGFLDGTIVCRGNPQGNLGLQTQKMGQNCAPISQCIWGGSEGAGSCGAHGYTVGNDPNWAYCNYPIWNGINPPIEIRNLGLGNECDSCVELIKNTPEEVIGKKCTINNLCHINDKTCSDSSSFKTCQQISHPLYAPFNAFTNQELCPSNTICNVNRCETDSDGDGFPDSLDQCPNNAPNEKVNKFGCPLICEQNEVKLIDGTCKALKQTCIDNNLNNLCDQDDPIVWADPDNNVPICADRDGNKVCDGVESLFCKDSNKNLICDSDETKWLITHCEDINGNGICDGIEKDNVLCSTEFNPVCDSLTNITYPNQCFADAFNAITISGACKVQPTIIRRDCTTGNVPIPSGYICDFETGWLFKRQEIYQNITIDCRTSSSLEGFTCQQVGSDWVWTRTELVEIDCFSLGCPKENQICQAGICVEEQIRRCPDQLDCKSIFGENVVCDEELGLCVAKQYFPIKIHPSTSSEDLESPKQIIWIIGGIIGIFIILRLLNII